MFQNANKMMTFTDVTFSQLSVFGTDHRLVTQLVSEIPAWSGTQFQIAPAENEHFSVAVCR